MHSSLTRPLPSLPTLRSSADCHYCCFPYSFPYSFPSSLPFCFPYWFPYCFPAYYLLLIIHYFPLPTDSLFSTYYSPLATFTRRSLPAPQRSRSCAHSLPRRSRHSPARKRLPHLQPQLSQFQPQIPQLQLPLLHRSLPRAPLPTWCHPTPRKSSHQPTPPKSSQCCRRLEARAQRELRLVVPSLYRSRYLVLSSD